MAFLCPSGFGRQKHKKGYGSLVGRLTRSDSIDTVTLEDLIELSYSTPESRRIVLHSFHACAPQEVTVKQGQKVNFIYKEDEWAYVTTDNKKQGFVPFTYCAKLGVPSPSLSSSRSVSTSSTPKRENSRRTIHSDVNSRKVSIESEGTMSSSCASDVADDLFRSNGYSYDSGTDDNSEINVRSYESPSSGSRSRTDSANVQSRSGAVLRSSTGSDVSEQTKCDISNDDEQESIITGIYSVLYDYSGKDAYDISVHADDIVFVLDARDPDWFWVQKPDGSQGYVPRNYLEPVERENKISTSINGSHRKSRPSSKHLPHNASIRDIRNGKDHSRRSNMSEQKPRLTLTDNGNINGRSNECMDLVGNRMKSPQKPPRTKKSGQSLTPRSIGSHDSMTTGTSLASFDAFGSLDDLDVSSRVHTPTEMSSACSTPRRNDKSFNRLEQVKIRHPHSKHQIDSVDGTVHYTNDSRVCSKRGQSVESSQRRPFSLPVFKSFDEYKRDYYDQYFYEDGDTEFRKPTNRNVVNVEEILRKRSERERQRKIELRKRDRSKEMGNVPKKATNLRDFLKNLNKAKVDDSDKLTEDNVGNQKAKNPVSDRSRALVQQQTLIDDSQQKPEDIMVHQYNEKVQTKENFRNGIWMLTGDPRKFSSTHNLATAQETDSKIEFRPRSNSHGQKPTDTGEPQQNGYNVMKTDWSFGYPRKNRSSDQLTGKDTICNMDSRSAPKTESNVKHAPIKCKDGVNKQDSRRAQKTDSNNGYVRDRSIANQDLCNEQASEPNGNNVHGRSDSVDGVIDVLRYLDEVCDAGDDKGDMYKDEVDDGNDTGDGEVDMYENDEDDNDKRDLYENEKDGICDGDGGLFKNGDYDDISYSYEDEDNDYCDAAYDKYDLYGEKEDDDKRDLLKDDNSETDYNKSDMYANEEDGDQSNRYDDEEYDVVNKCDQYDEEEEDDDMEELLRRTDELMQWTGELLDGHCDHDDDQSSVSSTEKCAQFLCNQTIGINGVDHNSNTMKDIDRTLVGYETYDQNENADLNSDQCSVTDRDSKNSKIKAKPDIGDIRGITEFIAQVDYDPEADDELPMTHGEIVHVGLDGQKSDHWYWAFSPRLRKYGFVPREQLKIPLITII